MSAQQLITEHLDIWTSAIKVKSSAGRGSNGKRELYGIKKLRELILELAVRGLLVPQDPNDEPASELLKKIAAEKARLVKEGKVKKQKLLPPITDEEKRFELAQGWEWVRLGELAIVVRGVTYKKAEASDVEVGGTVPLLRANNIGRGLNFDGLTHVPVDLVKAEQLLVEGDVLIAMSSGSADLVGKAAQAKEELNKTFGAFCGVIRSFSPALFTYFDFFFQTPLYRQQTRESGKGIGIQNLNQGSLSSLLVPLPPDQEGVRLITKVDELMALCDQLEQQTETSLSAQETLVETLLGVLVNAPSHDEFQAAWQRIAEHFDTLFTTEHSIDQLKQSILQLAVMGKLVPQNPNDEPASELLKKIASEKARLVKEGKIKKQKPLPPISEEEKPFELPRGWEWASLVDVYDVRDGTHDTPKYQEWGIPLVTSKNLSSGRLDLTEIKYISQEDHSKIRERSKVEKNDILFAMIGSIGNPVLIETDIEFSIKNVALFKYYSSNLSLPRFLLKYLFYAQIIFREQSSGAVQSFVSLGKIRSFPIALPPLSEQQRIVAKVDELMALCDQLKARLNQAQKTQLKLTDALTVLDEKAG